MNTFEYIMKRQIISLFFLFIISFHVIPIKSFFNWNQIEMSQEIFEDEVEKAEGKSKKFETQYSFFLECAAIPDATTIFSLNIQMGQLAQGHSNANFIPPIFS